MEGYGKIFLKPTTPATLCLRRLPPSIVPQILALFNTVSHSLTLFFNPSRFRPLRVNRQSSIVNCQLKLPSDLPATFIPLPRCGHILWAQTLLSVRLASEFCPPAPGSSAPKEIKNRKTGRKLLTTIVHSE
jgi:hypothetical protein